MRNIFEVLQEKEVQLRVLEKEVEALRVAAKIVAEADGTAAPVAASSAATVPGPVIAASAAVENKKRWP